jgi:hypothetical protein
MGLTEDGDRNEVVVQNGWQIDCSCSRILNMPFFSVPAYEQPKKNLAATNNDRHFVCTDHFTYTIQVARPSRAPLS